MNNYPPYDPNDPHSQPTTAGPYPQFPPPGQQPSSPQWGQQAPPPPQFPTNHGQYSQSGQNFPQYPPQYPQSGQFGPPPVQQKPPPPSWKDPKARREYFKQYPRSKKQQFMIGCGIPIIASVLLCSLCAIVGNALPKQPGQTAAVIQSPTTVQKTVEPTPTNTPTPAPTPKPTPTTTPTPAPTPTPTQAPVQQQPVQQPATQSQPVQSAPAPATGVNGNPWGYDFNPGNYIYSPNSGFCGYFSCISTFWNGNGYVEECSDGMYGKSGGISGSCSHHGGNYRPLYSH